MTIYRVLEQETSKEIFELVIDTERELIKLQEQNKIMRETLELILATDISSSAPDLLWLNGWRNNTKELAREALKKVGEMDNENN